MSVILSESRRSRTFPHYGIAVWSGRVAAYHVCELLPVVVDVRDAVADELRVLGVRALDGAGLRLQRGDARLDRRQVALHARQPPLQRHHACNTSHHITYYRLVSFYSVLTNANL